MVKITKKEEGEILVVYGSLKKGFWNYKHFLDDNSAFLGDGVVSGKMKLARGGYPYLFDRLVDKSNNEDPEYATNHKVEIYRVDKEIFDRIGSMERGAGYYAELIHTNYGEGTIFFASSFCDIEGLPVIPEYSMEYLRSLKSEAVKKQLKISY